MSDSVRKIGAMGHSLNPRTQMTVARETQVPAQLGNVGTMLLKKIVGSKLWNFSDLVQGRLKVFNCVDIHSSFLGLKELVLVG